MKTVIIVPAYNEDQNLINLIKKIKQSVNALIIIIDDSQNFKTKNLFKKKKKMFYIFIVVKN